MNILKPICRLFLFKLTLTFWLFQSPNKAKVYANLVLISSIIFTPHLNIYIQADVYINHHFERRESINESLFSKLKLRFISDHFRPSYFLFTLVHVRKTVWLWFGWCGCGWGIGVVDLNTCVKLIPPGLLYSVYIWNTRITTL